MSSTKSITICITGPESSGKSTLAESFSNKKNISIIPEYARNYVANLKQDYIQKDLETIAYTQLKLMKASDSQVTISDTGVEVIKIWNDEKFQSSERIEQLLREQLKVVDAYWLCTPDMPWQADPLRENPNDRMRLFKLYRNLLEELNVPYILLKGSHEERVSAALEDLEHKKTLG